MLSYAWHTKNSFHGVKTIAMQLTKPIPDEVRVFNSLLVPSGPDPAQEKLDGTADPVG